MAKRKTKRTKNEPAEKIHNHIHINIGDKNLNQALEVEVEVETVQHQYQQVYHPQILLFSSIINRNI